MIYQINMSKGQNIKIDEEDLKKIQENLSAPLIRVKQAIINPSFMVSITPTDEEDIVEKPKVEITNGVAYIVGKENFDVLVDKMTINKQLN